MCDVQKLAPRTLRCSRELEKICSKPPQPIFLSNGTVPIHKLIFKVFWGQAFVALGMTTPHHPVVPGEAPQKKIERAMFDLACAVNSLRNKVGAGHGRPWLPSVSDAEAKAAVEFMGIIAEWMLDAHSR